MFKHALVSELWINRERCQTDGVRIRSILEDIYSDIQNDYKNRRCEYGNASESWLCESPDDEEGK